MNVDKLKQSYLQKVCHEIHGIELQCKIQNELSHHIEDQYMDFLSETQNEEEAMNKALIQTGDPSELGKQMDKIHNPSPKWYVYLLTGLLLLFIYDKSIISYIDPPSIYLLVPIAIVISVLSIRGKRRWKNNRLIAAKSFVAAGILISFLEFIYCVEQVHLSLSYLKVNLIPVLYGLIIYILFTIIKPKKIRRLKHIA